jgi:uncharacterized protein (DUF1015 family)
MHIKPFKAIFPNLEYLQSVDSFFSTVKEDYPDYMESGFFSRSEEDAIYVYQIRRGARQFTGVICSSKIEDYLNGRIKKHECTIAAKEQRQLQLLLRRKAIVKPVLLTYPDVPEIDDLTQNIINAYQPTFDITFEEEGARHLVWRVTHLDLIAAFQDLFEKYVPYTYIADGHHRTSTNALLYNRAKAPELRKRYNELLSAFFPASQIDIYDFNRVVTLDDSVSMSSFLVQLSDLFNMKPLDHPRKPKGKFEIIMHIEPDEWYSLQWKVKILEQYKGESVLLDCSLLDEWVLKNILKLENLKENLQITYVEGPKGLDGIQKKVRKNNQAVGFCLYPVQFDEMIALVDEGKVLPPKSTWFEPRMKNGLVVLEF